MSINDTVADFLTRIRNACRASHEDVQIPYSVLNERIGKVIVDNGYIEDLQVIGDGAQKRIVVKLKYVDGKPVVNDVQRVSKPSKRVYVGYKDIKPVMNGLGVAILSTPTGVMSDLEAKKKRVGGEVICNIW